jgi:carbon monoxide dehydrogenase subunit G
LCKTIHLRFGTVIPAPTLESEFPKEAGMELTGDLLIEAPREKVWHALNDPQILVHCIPGCEDIQQLSPTETHTRVLLKMGPVRARFVGKILMSEVQPNQGCTLNFEGSGGAAGFARGSSVVALTSEGTATRLSYSATASIGGKLGQIGGRMIDASAKQMADQFFSALQKQLGAADVPAPTSVSAALPLPSPAAAPAPAPAPSVSRIMPPAVVAAPSGVLTEGVRVLWFCLGAAATGFGVLVASSLFR